MRRELWAVLVLVLAVGLGGAQTETPPAGQGGLTAEQLQTIMPRLKKKQAEQYAPILQKAMEEFDIDTPQRQAAFLAQVAHESGQLRYMEELASGKNYDPKTNPKLAKRLGNTEEGDGPLFKGRGPLQLTGRDNYKKAGEALKLDLEKDPASVATPEVGFRTSAWFWKKNGLNELADGIKTDKDFNRISKAVNRGNPDASKPALHEKERLDYFKKIQKAQEPPKQPNVGPYEKQAEKARILFDDTVPRGQKMREIQRRSPMDTGFGGVILGNETARFPRVAEARFSSGASGPVVEVVAADGAKGVYADISATELWCAYRFLRPDKALQALGARAGDLGLVGIARNKMSTHGSWEFGIHPAIADTVLAREAMALDMVIAQGDPRLPALPGGWITYRWFDEAADIALEDGRVRVRAAKGPADILLRVDLWDRKQALPGDTTSFVAALHERFEGLRRIEAFAKLIAVLQWLEREGKLPPLPDTIRPQRFSLPNECAFVDVLTDGSTILTDRLTSEDARDPYIAGAFRQVHDIRLAEGKDYLLDMVSFDFDPFLRLGDANGNFLAEDDDSAGGLNARLAYVPTEGGPHKLVATTYKAGATGRFFLKVWEGRVGPGHSLLLTSRGLGAGDPLDAVRRNSHHKVHPIRLVAGEMYRIDMVATFDAYLRVEDAQRRQVASDDDGGEERNARLRFTPERTGEYRLIATSFGRDTGGYTLSVVRER